MMALREGMTCERDAEKRAPYAQRSLDFMGRITDTLSKKMVRMVKNRWDDDIWAWDREGFRYSEFTEVLRAIQAKASVAQQEFIDEGIKTLSN